MSTKASLKLFFSAVEQQTRLPLEGGMQPDASNRLLNPCLALALLPKAPADSVFPIRELEDEEKFARREGRLPTRCDPRVCVCVFLGGWVGECASAGGCGSAFEYIRVFNCVLVRACVCACVCMICRYINRLRVYVRTCVCALP